MGFLILDGSGPGVRAALSGLGAREATRAGELAGQVQALLAAHGLAPAALSAIVGIVGPGSFTGLRAALALAHGLAAASGRPLVAVATAEAIAAALPGQPLLAAFATGRAGRFAVQAVHADGRCAPPVPLDAAGAASLAVPAGAALAGPAAEAVAALLAVAGRTVPVAPLARPPDSAIAAVAAARLAGRIAPLPAAPIYADDLFATRQ